MLLEIGEAEQGRQERACYGALESSIRHTGQVRAGVSYPVITLEIENRIR